MKSTLFTLAAATAASFSLLASTAHAQFGPFADFRSEWVMDAGFRDTGCLYACGTPWAKFGIRDRVFIEPLIAAPGPALAGVVVVSGDLDPTGVPIGNWDFTTFYGVDNDPSSSDEDLTLTGFDTTAVPVSFVNETFIGINNEYPAQALGLFPLGDLPSEPAFDGIDFSSFVGDPTSVVYAFTATVPISDIEVTLVPEPSAAALMLLGLCTLRKRRR